MAPNITLTDYLLIFSPEEPLKSKIKAIKKIFKEDYQCLSANHSQPHITLAHFAQYEHLAKYTIDSFKKSAQSICPFQLDLRGFGHFTNQTYTIYIKVLQEIKIAEIVMQLRTKFRHQLHSVSAIKPQYTKKDPHLTIAKGMSKEQFEQAWPIWEKQTFDYSYQVKQMTLLKRELHPSSFQPLGKYQIAETFTFGGEGKFWEQSKMF